MPPERSWELVGLLAIHSWILDACHPIIRSPSCTDRGKSPAFILAYNVDRLIPVRERTARSRSRPSEGMFDMVHSRAVGCEILTASRHRVHIPTSPATLLYMNPVAKSGADRPSTSCALFKHFRGDVGGRLPGDRRACRSLRATRCKVPKEETALKNGRRATF